MEISDSAMEAYWCHFEIPLDLDSYFKSTVSSEEEERGGRYCSTSYTRKLAGCQKLTD